MSKQNENLNEVLSKFCKKLVACDMDIFGLRGNNVTQDEDKWITVHPGGKGMKADGSGEKGGTPVLIDGETGEIKGGMGGKFTGKRIGEVRKNFVGPQTPSSKTLQANTRSDDVLKQAQNAVNGSYIQPPVTLMNAIRKMQDGDTLAFGGKKYTVKNGAFIDSTGKAVLPVTAARNLMKHLQGAKGQNKPAQQPSAMPKQSAPQKTTTPKQQPSALTAKITAKGQGDRTHMLKNEYATPLGQPSPIPIGLPPGNEYSFILKRHNFPTRDNATGKIKTKNGDIQGFSQAALPTLTSLYANGFYDQNANPKWNNVAEVAKANPGIGKYDESNALPSPDVTDKMTKSQKEAYYRQMHANVPYASEYGSEAGVTDKPMTVYRGMSLPQAEWDKMFKNVGTESDLRGYSSATVNKDVAASFMHNNPATFWKGAAF